MKVIIIGAGRVGLGALGVALALQGHELVFAARRDEIVQTINEHGFDVITKGATETKLEVRGVRAVKIPGDEFARELASADQVYTSVRPDNLPWIAPVIAEALLFRVQEKVAKPLDVFCCENLKNAGSQLERLIFTALPFQYAQEVQERVGFNAAISDRIVSSQEADEHGRQMITADVAGDVLFDTLQLKGDFNALPPFKGIDNFPASMEEKLYVLNCGHAVCAYLGFQKGYTYIHEAMADPEINHAVVGAMLESQRALQGKHGRALHYAAMINDILESFSNAALMDTIARVGRDPIRKLQADDRLIGPLKLAYRYGIEPVNLMKGCAAGFAFSPANDPQAAELQKLIGEKGFDRVLDYVAQLRSWNPIAQMIREEYRQLVG
jgi:mannitol-1-phosphate 5-dehydrogenase